MGKMVLRRLLALRPDSCCRQVAFAGGRSHGLCRSAPCLQYFQATLAAEIRAAKAEGKVGSGDVAVVCVSCMGMLIA